MTKAGKGKGKVGGRCRSELAALRQSEELYRSLVDTCPDGITVTDLEGRVVMINDQGARMYGCRNAAEMMREPHTAFEFVIPEDRERALAYTRKTFEEGSVSHLEYTLLRKDGSRYPAELSASVVRDAKGAPRYFIGVVRDISDRKRADEERQRLQEQVARAQKLESLGVLAGGIAHDFNNLLMGILGNASLALRELPPEAPVRTYLEQIEKTGVHATDLIRQVLAYSGRGRLETRPVDLSAQVEEVVQLLRVSIPAGVKIACDPAPSLPPLQADVSQIRQVIMNLLTNAAEAVGEGGGSVRLRTGIQEVDRAALAGAYLREDRPEGQYLFLEVSDTGCGIAAAIRDRIFDPFYTTKFTGRGLGLAAVLGIVRGHGGIIRVESDPGRGTTFSVLFPLAGSRGERSAEMPEQTSAETSAAPAGGAPAARRAGCVLVVDDEEIVRQVARKMLESAGFQVLVARGGREGVDLFRAHAERVIAVVLDATMPQMNGEETFRELKRIRPGVKVILSSGYDQQEATSRFLMDGISGFIQKPYRIDQLLSKMDEVLSRR